MNTQARKIAAVAREVERLNAQNVRWGVVEYVREEVLRQGHDVTRPEGIARVGWMLNAWHYALNCSEVIRQPHLEDIIQIGKRVEPHKNSVGLRRVNVKVGGSIPPHYDFVAGELEALLKKINSIEPMEFYKRFEEIHPFVDGNGRSGKVLLNWLSGTLLAPIFPPNDLFGYPIVNP